jgi:Tfp pilus tip-associated adhesin PilY1
MKSYHIAKNIHIALESARQSALGLPESAVAIVPLRDGKYVVATGFGSLSDLAEPVAGSLEILREDAESASRAATASSE